VVARKKAPARRKPRRSAAARKPAAGDRIRDPDTALTYVLWQAQRCTERLLVEALQPLGVTLSQFGVLLHLKRAPGLTGAELARRLDVTPQSVSVAAAEARAAGWLHAAAHAVHRGLVELEITAAGSAVLQRALSRVESVEERITSLGAGERDTLLRLLLRLRHNAREATHPG
jgi:DNA-binding MarR family transcriptional regulator